jgi:hypothetical protein
MGCFDIFCIICGNPCHGMFNPKNIQEIIDEYNTTKKKNKYYDYIYEAYLKNPNLIKDLSKFRKKTLWMDKCTMLLVTNKVEHNCKEIACNISFANKNGKYTHLIGNYNSSNSLLSDGIFVHTDCYKYIKLKYNVQLKYGNLPLIDSKPINYYKTIKFINYGNIEKYWEQDFLFEKIFVDNKQYLCSSPLKNDKNITQIKKNINSMKISNKYLLRPSPPISATFYSNGNMKVGNNGKLWIIKNGKWNEIKKDLCKIIITFDNKKITNKQNNFFKKLSFVGQYNNNPSFMISYTVKKSIDTVTILTIVDNKDMIEKLFS